AYHGSLANGVAALADVWRKLHLEEVVEIDASSLAGSVLAWGAKLVSGGSPVAPRVHGLVETAPLRRLLERLLPENEEGEIAGLAENLGRCDPEAVAVTTLDYNTGQTVTWAAGCDIQMWERPLRRSVRAKLTIDHVLASASLPIIFPAVRLGRHWHGDGGIRLSAPLAPALHLGARRILAISTHHAKSFAEADEPQTPGYPPPAQILGQLMDAIFLDAMDDDALRLERANALLRDLPPGERHGYRLVDLAVVRPSESLGRLAAQYEPQLPRAFRFLTRSLGTQETSNADFLSLLMFVPEYLQKLIEMGEADAEARRDALERVAGGSSAGGPAVLEAPGAKKAAETPAAEEINP
ncbi:MAG TPA: patatin-like phospholipase family protein, partial [Thermoanaerobaculia bacterium]|nr:patatin-like phospholipase family protein [Thermoanaerobaculia bacterium]